MNICTTKRLILAEATLDDVQFFFELLNSLNWIKYIGDRGIKTTEQAASYIQNSLIKSYLENGFGLYKMCLKETMKPIGICGFVKRNYLNSADIGFAILPQFEGQGYTSEAAAALLIYGKDKLDLAPIYAITTEENKASCSLLLKIGLFNIGKIKPNELGEEFILFSDKNEELNK